MNRQIKEVEKLCQFFKDGNCTICEELLVDCHSNCPMHEFAKRILEAGYSKASDVAAEVFAEIEQAIFAHGTKYAMKRLEELKKKYEVTEDES